MHRPGQVARRLAINPATLRVWSGEFASFLSDAARKSLTETGTRAQRRYTDADIELLQRAKIHLNEGLTYVETRAALASPLMKATASATGSDTKAQLETEASEATSAPIAIIEDYRRRIVSMQQSIEDKERIIQAHGEHLATLQTQLDRAQTEAQELRRALVAELQKQQENKVQRFWLWDWWDSVRGKGKE